MENQQLIVITVEQFENYLIKTYDKLRELDEVRDPWLDIQAVANLFGVSYDTVINWRKRHIEPLQFHGQPERIKLSEAEKWFINHSGKYQKSA